jgi:hypothetical protein
VAEQDAPAPDQPEDQQDQQDQPETTDDAGLVTPTDVEAEQQGAEAEEGTLFPEPAAAPAAEEEGRKRRGLRRKTKRAPEQTRDDTDAGWGELFDSSAHDRWLQEQRPPHWGRD